jgi:RimJ/RimL family protein N-acetyltransferase
VAQDPSINQWLALDRPLPDLISVGEWIVDGHALYEDGLGFRVAVADSEDDRVLGCVELRLQPRLQATAGYWTQSAERARGVAKRALALVCDYAFSHQLAWEIALLTLPGNIASEHVAAANGFTREDQLLSRYDQRLGREVTFNVFVRALR